MNCARLVEWIGWRQLWLAEIASAWAAALRQRAARNLGRTIRPQGDLFAWHDRDDR